MNGAKSFISTSPRRRPGRFPQDAKSGELLFAEAGEPKEFWYEPAIGHVMFEAKFPEEYEKRVIGFLDKHLSTN